MQNTTDFPTKTLKYDPIIYSLETPKYHLLQFDANNRFAGWVFNFGKLKINSINVYNDEQFVGNFIVDGLREDVGGHVPSIAAAKTCGNAFSQRVYFKKLRQEITAIHKPAGELVYLTQGHYHVEEYQNSIIPGVLNMRQYLEHSGVDLNNIHSLLDFGCGSGRYLVGWHLIAPHIALHGCDLNTTLMSWAQNNLPNQIKCLKNNLIPPLSYPDNQFELIYFISVFTHLSLNLQKIWIQELKRILKVGGYILLTLHGEFYVRNCFWQESDKIEEFLSSGLHLLKNYFKNFN